MRSGQGQRGRKNRGTRACRRTGRERERTPSNYILVVYVSISIVT